MTAIKFLNTIEYARYFFHYFRKGLLPIGYAAIISTCIFALLGGLIPPNKREILEPIFFSWLGLLYWGDLEHFVLKSAKSGQNVPIVLSELLEHFVLKSAKSGQNIRDSPQENKPMPINLNIRLNNLDLTLTDITGEAAILITKDSLSDLATLAAIPDQIERTFGYFDMYVDVSAFEFAAIFGATDWQDFFNHTSHTAKDIFDNPLIGKQAKDSLSAWLKSTRPQSLTDRLTKMERAPLGRKTPPAGYVYLLQADLPDRPCKIGYTSKLPDRLKTFGVKLPFEFELLHSFPCDDARAAEKKLHECYEKQRGNGEWFNLNEAHIAEIKAITGWENGGFTFDFEDIG